MKKRVAIGLSGGVDSSVAALMLKNQGYEVIGLFMKNWEETSFDGVCSAQEDFEDVRRVCAVLDIPYYTVNFAKEYFDNVFKLFVSEYQAGRTPNPDVLCNREIKFGCFRDYAMKLDADYIATGHYCRIIKKDNLTYLAKAVDQNKCQTYFLNQVSSSQLDNVLFPIGDLYKEDVRKIAAQEGLITAKKKDSTGICFIGERNFRSFLSSYIPMKEGLIKTLDGKVVGKHKGVFYYTIGQRKGFGMGGVKGQDNLKPWFIIDKDVKENILYVNQGEHPKLYSKGLVCQDFNFITKTIETPKEIEFRIRHRQPLQKGIAVLNDDGSLKVEFSKEQRAVTLGQYCVLYEGEVCLGGGVITQKF